MLKDYNYIESTKNWIRDFVINYGLCPFANQVFINDEILFSLELSENTHKQLIAFWNMVNTLRNNDTYKTAILVLPNAPSEFVLYLELFDKLEILLKEFGIDETFQLAGFHPQYIFQDSNESDPANYTNRSPYPLVHLLYVEQVSEAINTYPDIHNVPLRNISKMKKLGLDELRRQWDKFREQ